jgi:formate dehydrogenase subunit gamma
MTTAVNRFDDAARRRVNSYGRTTIGEDELLRHPVYTRLLHWSAAIFFVLALLSGFAVYTPWLYRWLTPIFGGGPTTRLLHPWFSLGFVVFFGLQVLNWILPMRWTSVDSRWIRRIRAYVTNADRLEPDDVGFFNGGQKLYFWAIVVSALMFLISGFPMWFPEIFGRPAVAIGYVLHDIAGLVMLVGFIVHIYESTAHQPGTLQSMTRGIVSKRWAWTHHPAWYRESTGRDPRADYERTRARAKRIDPDGE